ncbi:MAG TPA: hypothetical protein VFZ53_01890, partial [Polyangiaceae bacterium]
VVGAQAEIVVRAPNAATEWTATVRFTSSSAATASWPALRSGILVCENPLFVATGTESTVLAEQTIPLSRAVSGGSGVAGMAGASGFGGFGGIAAGNGGLGGAAGSGGSAGGPAVTDLGESCSIEMCMESSTFCYATAQQSCDSGLCTGSGPSGFCSKSCQGDGDCVGGRVAMRCVTSCTATPMEFAAQLRERCWDEMTYPEVASFCGG